MRFPKFCSELDCAGLLDLGFRSLVDELDVISVRIGLPRNKNFIMEGCTVGGLRGVVVGSLRKAWVSAFG